MMSKIRFSVCLVLLCVELTPVECVTANTIQSTAQGYVRSTLWSYSSGYRTGRNTNKCNLFVADVFDRAGASVPHRSWWRYSPIGAGEWENSRSSYLRRDRCWEPCSTPTIGDVIAYRGHVGIVTGQSVTTSAARDEVVENDWGFRSGQSPTCWRYQYSSC